ncbi:hypothetical protein E2C01_085229 [Portunus trituberculatus]|uniref:Uncharacterized protein n=1 Tax=Portunus trituberculatus TaxID=210409 RepID=A0A5B7J714_PORTR|nr:hypothetical protein [Portunus trituberculatus]
MEAMWKKRDEGEVILMRCRSCKVLGEVDPTVVQEALSCKRLVWPIGVRLPQNATENALGPFHTSGFLRSGTFRTGIRPAPQHPACGFFRRLCPSRQSNFSRCGLAGRAAGCGSHNGKTTASYPCECSHKSQCKAKP